MIERMGLGYTSTDALESRTTSTEMKCQRKEKEGEIASFQNYSNSVVLITE